MPAPVKAEPQRAPTQETAKKPPEREHSTSRNAHSPMRGILTMSLPTPSNQHQAMLNLQCTIGNRATVRLLQRLAAERSARQPGPVQPELTVGKSDDPLEREADAAASRIEAGQPVERISPLPAGDLAPSLHRQEEEKEEEREELQTEPVQRVCTECESEELVQRPPEDVRAIRTAVMPPHQPRSAPAVRQTIQHHLEGLTSEEALALFRLFSRGGAQNTNFRSSPPKQESSTANSG